MDQLSQRLARLSPDQIAALMQRLRGAEAASAPAGGITRRPGTGPSPLSFAQQRLWFIQQLDLQNTAYNEVRATRLDGTLDAAALQRALDTVVARHEALRTVFLVIDGEPVQQVVEGMRVVMPVEDLQSLDPAEHDAEVERRARREQARPFELSAGPLLRATLLRMAPERHVLLLSMHHVISDGWSRGVIVGEISAAYTAFVKGEEPSLPELPVQYPDYAVWQRERLQGAFLQEQLGYWQEKLAGAPEVMELPTDHPRPPVQSFAGESHRFRLPDGIADSLRALAREEEGTLFMVLLAAFKTLLARYTGQADLVVGTPVANRGRGETEGLVGFFVNTLALRTDLSGDPTFREALRRVRDTALGAYAHEELPFERVVEALHPERSLSRNLVFQVMFLLDESPVRPFRLPSLELSPMEADAGTSMFDLTLALEAADGGLGGRIEYATSLFDAATMERMAEHLGVLLRGIAANPDARISALPLMGGGERALLAGANATERDYPSDLVHALFAAQAARTPDAAALVFRGEALSYGELDARANRLANHLRGLGVEPEVRVGVCMDRTPEMIVALLGVLKAGGAYVPLDPAYPRERLGWIVQDAGIRLVLTTTDVADRLPAGAEAVALDALRDRIAAEPADAPATGVGPENLSHVIFTSGSTGRPKGVMIRHSSTATLLHWMRETIADEERAAVLGSTSISFDVSVAEMFGALCWGGTLVLVDNALELPSVADQGIRYVSMVPTAAAELLRSGGIPASVRTVNLAGEALPNDLAQGLYALGTVETVRNLYGPTEDTSYSTYSVVERGGDRVLIGRPLANSQAYVLDGQLQPSPVGVPGELFLAGAGLARGYEGQPRLTAERFLPDPSGPAGSRMYRTMDRVRRTGSGELEYLGRTDFQVKVRGFRIELGEIETALRASDAVADAVVLVREDAPGDRRLVAYLVPAEGVAVPAAADLRIALKDRLPEYMVPAAFVTLEALPLTGSGKVDRKALPAPDASAGVKAYAAPRTPPEELLAGVFAEVLGLERVGVHDDFFDAGGHSLLAMRVSTRVRESLGVDLPVRALFEAPTVAELAAKIDALRAAGAYTGGIPMRVVPRDGHLPLSFAQQRLWFIDQMEPGRAAYNLAGALRIRGALDVPALERSLTEVIRRHEVLRTRFANVDGDAVQVIDPVDPVRIPVVELQAGDDDAREAELRALAAEEALRPFDLRTGPLLRSTLVRLGEDEHALLFTMHHVISDGWSIGVLVHEVSALYAAFTEGHAPVLPVLPVQYADYAAWQRAHLSGPVLDAQMAYWRKALAGAPARLELPTDHPRPAVPTDRGGTASFTLPPEATRALRALSRREGTTVFMTLLAAWQLLLSRYSGQDDVLVGSPIAGRGRGEVENLVGFFVNTLVLRGDLSGDPTFRGLLRRVRETALGAYGHQDVPFEKLVEELQPERSRAHTPFFQVMFSQQNAEPSSLRLGEAQVESLELDAHAARFDLGLAVAEDGETLRGVLTYRSDLFDAATAERMLAHYASLLGDVAADATRKLSAYALLAQDERRRVLEEWNDTAADFPRDRCVHELFAAQAARTPDAVALRFGVEAITYAELDARANRLAHHLRALGVRTDARVGLCLERGAEVVVAVLGILKAGGAYLPLDPGYPDERLRYLLDDAAPAAVVTREGLAERVAGFGGPVVRIDADAAAIGAQPATAPAEGGVPESGVYVIYTSGSTGLPKGVTVEHRSLTSYLTWFDRTVLGAEGFDLPLLARLSFDAHVRPLFAPLLRGDAVWMLPEATVADPGALLAELSGRERVSFSGVPSLWSAVVDRILAGEGTAPAGLRVITLGGEALQPALVERTRALFPDAQIWNHYGPTEATINVTVARVDGAERITIGRPVANVRAYVLDAHLQPLPVGIPGELYAGGIGVARGYLGRPALTAERFVPDPFAAEPGARMYRTGDRVRWTPAGEVEYLGRTDFQLKVNGFRIEPGEIEAALETHPAVRRAIVIAREGAGGSRLVGYVVADEAPAAAELRGHLKARLPDYMVPAAFVPLDALPLTRTGKLDRRALPAPQPDGDSYVTPRTRSEEILAGVYAEVLGTDRVGAHDDFFALGGHSLLATRLVSRVRQGFGVELPLRALFDHPTVEGLASAVDALAPAQGAPPIVPVPRDQAPPLSFAQQRLWFIDQLQPGSAVYNVPYALRLRGPLDAGALERSLAEIVRRHETLRTRFPSVNGQPLQVIEPAGPVAVTRVDLSDLPDPPREEVLRERAAAEARAPFDLGTGPLLRATLVRLAAEEHVLLLTLHHIVSDGWSTGVLAREVSALYGAFVRGQGSPLAPLPVQYADYAVWQRAWVRDETLDAQLAWWRQRLAGAPSVLELPTDRPRPLVAGDRGGSVPFVLPPKAVRALRTLAAREGATLFMTLLAGWQLLLARYSGQDDVSVGTPIAGRTRLETEGLIGLFVNTLVLRTDLSGQPTFRALLGRVRETTLGAYQHQDVPFEKLVDALAPERSLSHTPLFQTALVLQNNVQEALELGDLTAEPLPPATETVHFDLTLTLAESETGVSGSLFYRAELFDATTAERMVEHLQHLLREMTADPDQRVTQVELLRGAERARVLQSWNVVHATPPRDASIHARFEAQVARTPDAVALSFGDETLTYAELNARANRLAHHLARLGAGPEVRVGIFLERGVEMVVAVLGVLKAGGAYVPMDPGYPAGRLAHMLADSGVRVVVTQDALAGALPEQAGVRRVSLDAAAADIAAESAENPASGAMVNNLAYVIYTSGSTGTPKGALIEHCNVLRLFTATDAWFGFGPDDVWTLFHSVAFDFSVWEIWGALLYGGRLVVVPFDVSRDPEAFHALVQRERVTVLNQTPSAFRQFIRADAERGGELSLREVIFGGEALEPASLREWADRHGVDRPRLVNMYGITETTVHVTYRPLSREDVYEGAGSPIGVRIPDLRLYVCDAGMHPVPIGVPGELYVGGAGVARGYLNRPALTAERFLENPYGTGRLYRTGDRVRWLADGTLEYLGRLDEQVKVRGFRIELGEIEAALLDHDGVRECAVIVREDEPGDRRIVAYIVGGVPAESLRTHLQQRLPDYMVPGAFVEIGTLPLTPNGKLDRAALPAPEYAAAEFVAPRTPVEAALAQVWAEVLRVDRVGVEENFFALGGDSILSIQVVSRARRAGIELSPRQVFQYQTIAQLAAVAGTAGGAGAAEQGRVDGAVPLTPIQAWFFEQEQPAPWHYNQAVLLEIDPALSTDALELALTAVLEHHDALRLRFRRAEGGWEQWHASEVGIALERIDLGGMDAAAQDRAQEEIAAERQAGMDLAQGPLGRAVLFDRGARGRVLLLAVHHLVVDGVSWRILRDDLELACAEAARGATIETGAKSTSFRQWSQALQAYAGTDALAAEAAYWQAQGPEGTAPLPVDHADAAGEGGRVIVRLDADETRALLQDVPAAYRTQINDVLLSALADVLSGWTGSPRVRIALEGHGREEEIGAGVDLTRTVGWFTTVYPLVLDVAGAEGPGERLKRVKEQLRAIPVRGIGYGVLRYLSPDAEMRRALAGEAEPQVSFNYLGQFDPERADTARIRFTNGPTGPTSAPENRHRYLLEVNSGVTGGRLELGWAFGGAHEQATIERLAAAYLDALRATIAHCTSAGAGGVTPSDFPLAALTQAELDAIVGTGAAAALEDLYPLSPMQEGMLFESLSGEGAQAYQVQLAQRLDGRLDAELLRRAWVETLRRHPILRTSFVSDGLRRPLQRVHADVELPWRVEDWTGLDEAEQEAAMARHLAADSARGFRLDEAPVMRFTLFRVSEHTHWFAWNVHHLLLDGWSTARVTGEVAQLYRAWSKGAAVDFGPVRPYRDYIGWLGRQDLDAAERYWRGVLAGFAAPTAIGADRPAAAGAAMRHIHLRRQLSADLTTRLEALAQRAGVTLNTVMQGAWGLLLSRYAGEDDVVFGTTVSGRPPELEGVEEMVGLFINTLPVRIAVPRGARLSSWLSGVQRTQVEAREYEYTPLVQVQAWSDVPRGTPLFESLYVFENYPIEQSANGQVDEELRMSHGRGIEASTYPLSLVATPAEELRFILSGDDNRFDRDTLERMLAQFVRVLEQAAADPAARLDDVELMDAAERRTVLEAWAGAESPYHPRPVHELVAEQAARTPDAAALTSGGTTLTYAALDAAANRLAHHLAAHGAGPETLVGVVAERAPETVVAILAVLKSGAAYVPLDPAYPADRLRYMLADSGAPLVVGYAPLPAGVADDDGARFVDARAEADAVAARPADAPRVAMDAENLAYVVYTSGSTGRPKGVAVTHRGIGNLVGWKTSRLGQRGDDRALQFASLSFDAAVEEVFGALLTGGTLVMADRDALMPGEPLRETLRRERVSFATLPPAALAVMEPGDLPDLRVVVSAGEALPAAVAARWAGAVELHNAYGPTEATVSSASGRVTADGRPPAIGHPLPNVRAYVLDSVGRPVPPGLPGELHVGGVQVARGYLGRAGLTAERFVPDPFATRPGARLYATGDRARWRTDGTLEYLGRVDEQVKVRGFRIEPGEIEAVLRTHASVADCAVVAREDVPGERQLVAYVVPAWEEGVRLWPSIGEYFVYDELIYHGLTHDHQRNERYLRALRRVAVGKIVLDVGTGADAILSRLAVEAGAKHVYAVELLEASYNSARERIRSLGLEDRITVLHGDARTVEVPELADVCVSEIVESLAGGEGAAVILNQAWRLLKPGAVMIPGWTRTMMSAVTLPDEIRREPSFSRAATHYVRRIFEEVGHPFDLRLTIRNFPAENMLSSVGIYEDLDFNAGIVAPEYVRHEELVVERDGIVDGLLLWLRMELGEEVLDGMEHETAWLPAYFPLFDPGVEVRAGDRLLVECHAALPPGGIAPDYGVRGRIVRADGGEDVPFDFVSYHHDPRFRATPFYRRLFADGGALPDDNGGALHDALREHLRARLPEYMVPGAFMLMDEFPLTPNGKLDRRALPSPEQAEGGPYVAPRTPEEEVLAGIWAEVLRRDRVGVEENFFELGGHSLLATRVVSRVRKAFGVDVPLKAFFEDPTVAAGAAWLEARRGGPRAAELPPVEAVAQPGVWLPLSFAQQRLWLAEEVGGASSVYNQALGVRLTGPLDAAAMEQALSEVVRRHAVFRTRFVERDGVPGQVIDEPRPLPMARVDLSGRADRDEALAALVREHERAPFDLATGPLLRVLLVRLDEDEHALLLAMHHISSDGWSSEILFREVAVLYGAFAAGQPSPLPELPVQYADYAVWQRGWLTAEREREQLEFWRDRLAGAPRLRLATDRAADTGSEGGIHRFALSPELSEEIRRLSRSLDATLFMTLLSAFKVLLRWQGGGDDVVVGTDVANRNLREETEGLIGFFVNQLVLRTRLEGGAPFRETVARVRQTALNAYDHQDVPFDRVVEVLRPERAAGETPFFRVKFGLQNAPSAPVTGLAGLGLEPLESARNAAQVDVLLGMHDDGERIAGSFEYRTGLFSPELMARWSRRLEALLAAAVEDPARDLDALAAHLQAEEAREAQAVQAALKEKRRARFAR